MGKEVDDKLDKEDDADAEDDPAKQAKEELVKIDSNKDGKADLAEITTYMKKEFYGPEDIKEEKLTAAQVDKKSAEDAKEYLEEFTAHYKQDADDVDSELDEAEDEGDEAGDED